MANRFILEQYKSYYRLIMEKHAEKTHYFDNQTNDKEFDEDYRHEKSKESSISRSIRNVRRISHSNDWDYFVTLTVKSEVGCNRYVLDEVIDKMKKVMKASKRVCHNFKYLLIAEEHPTSGAYHFHGLMYGIDEEYFYLNKNNHISCSLFDELGFQCFEKIRNHNAVSNYITKYISKDVCRDSNNRVYWCSRGLSKGDRYEIEFVNNLDIVKLFGPQTHFVDLESGEIIPRYYDSEFCAVRDFQLDNASSKYSQLVSDEDLLILRSLIEKKYQFKKLN